MHLHLATTIAGKEARRAGTSSHWQKATPYGSFAGSTHRSTMQATRLDVMQMNHRV
jgi:hypothetical protein